MNDTALSTQTNRGKAWWLVAILFFASIVSVLDRGILSIVVDAVKADLLLSDVQISLLQGLAFGLFYATVGVPLGLIADRYSRRWLIIAGVSLWSIATVCSGFASSFAELFVARILVGLGEAALAPAAISLIADLFPPQQRGRPISIYLTGQALANGLSITITSFFLAAIASGAVPGWHWLIALAPWRLTFMACGLLGFAVVAAMLSAREPPRQSFPVPHKLRQQAVAALHYLARNKQVFIPLYLGFALCFMAAYGAGAWVPTMLRRAFGATSVQIGQWLGPLSMLFSVTGPSIGGLLIDRYARRKNPVAKFSVLAIAPLCVIPSALAAFVPNLHAAMAVAASGALAIGVTGTTTLAVLQSMVPGNMRGVAIALTGLINTLFGATTGPLFIALLTEHVYRDPAQLGYSVAAVVIPALLLSSVLFWVARRALAQQLLQGGEAASLTSG